jgi:hypothetical protein
MAGSFFEFAKKAVERRLFWHETDNFVPYSEFLRKTM